MKSTSRINDLFLVYIDDAIITEYEQVLINLYQPFLSGRAIALYLTLKNCNYGTDPVSYHKLVTSLNYEFETLKTEFEKLEAANLITTYEGKVDEFSIIIYQVNSPLSPYQFLKDPSLVKVLESFIGIEALEEIKHQEQLRVQHLKLVDGLTNISHLLKDVYRENLVTPTAQQEQFQPTHLPVEQQIQDNFNFDTFLILLPASIRLEYQFSHEIQQLIYKLAEMYAFTSEQMAIVFNLSLQKGKGIVTPELLRKEAYDYVVEELRRENIQQQPNKTATEEQSDAPQQTSHIQNDAARKALLQMQRLSAQEYVKMITGSLTPQDCKNIDRLAIDYQLEQEVINVLINYVYYNKKTLSLPLMEAIAQTWHKQGIKTAEEAYIALRENQKKAKKHQENKQKKAITYERRTEKKSNFDDQKLDLSQAEIDKLFEGLE